MAFDKPTSINEQERTVEIIASTGAGVSRFDMEGPLLEVLEISPSAIDMSRIDTGMSLLDAHQQNGLDHVLGKVEAARIESGNLIVRVKISERADGVWQDIKAGIIKSASVGYQPLAWSDGVDPVTGQRVRTVTKWRLLEVSLVPVPADAGAHIRSSHMETKPSIPASAPAGTTAVSGAPSTRAAVNSEIRALGQTFGIEQAVLDGLIDREASVDEARAAILDSMKQRQAPVPRVSHVADYDSPEQRIERLGEALYCRANPRVKPSDAARQFMNLTTLDMARESLRASGVNSTAMSPADTITRALHTTADFPAIFADTANRTLRASYEVAPAVLKRVARQTTARDFRAKTAVQLGEAPTLEKVNEAGEYRYGSLAEAKESYKIDTFGKIIALSRKALVNDDLGAFVDMAARMGAAAAEFEAQFLVNLLLSNPTMNDSKALFHADHSNLGSYTSAPDLDDLSAARLAMRRQTGLSGKPINVTPRFVVAPPELETDFEKLLASIQPMTSGDVNPFGGKLDLLVDARLPDGTFYVAGDPAMIEGLEYAYLQGSEGPQIESRAGFEVDGVEIKVRLDFGAAFLDHRGWYKCAVST